MAQDMTPERIRGSDVPFAVHAFPRLLTARLGARREQNSRRKTLSRILRMNSPFPEDDIARILVRGCGRWKT
ncbi:hypothetical protein [Microbacterium sp. gxy059]|uniref:hypothetical protein n=1 Tax=Microbacterium sp. gxy059 TaxID=2957199 RepID=UPI003D9A01DC